MAASVGVAAGEPIADEDDLHGMPVVIASRLSAAAGAGEVLVQDVVGSLVASRDGMSLKEAREYELRGVHVQCPWYSGSVKTVPAGEFKQTCLRLLDEVGASGEPIVITKRDKPVAQLTPLKPGRAEDWLGTMRDRGEIAGDLVAPATEPGEWGALAD